MPQTADRRTDRRTACLDCDLIVDLSALRAGQRARCPRCDHLLSARVPNALSRSAALASAALVFLLLANAFPFLALEASGIEQVMTLPRSAAELWDEGDGVIAALVLGPIVGVPGLLLCSHLFLCWALTTGWHARWLVPAGRVLCALGSWSMVEVFLIGVLVSMVKIGELADVVFGFSFWSYACFVVCFTATVSSIDRMQIWEEIERCSA